MTGWGARERQDVEKEIGKEPEAREYEDRELYQAAKADYARRFARSKQFQEAYLAKVADTATLSRSVGNIYTGSIYLGLASLLELQKIRAGKGCALGLMEADARRSSSRPLCSRRPHLFL